MSEPNEEVQSMHPQSDVESDAQQPVAAGEVADGEGVTGESLAPPEIDWKDRYVRLAADFDNFRKRSARELAAATRFGLARAMRDWLEVYDTLSRAVAASQGAAGEWAQGLDAIQRQMDKVLATHAITRIASQGARFDPTLHEALATVPVAAEQDGVVVHTEREGFAFEDGEVLRTARVVVGRAPRE